MLDPSKSWKIDVDILRSPQYENIIQGLLYCDEEDRLWLPVTISFDASQTTDAWWGVETSIILMSEDGGADLADHRPPVAWVFLWRSGSFRRDAPRNVGPRL